MNAYTGSAIPAFRCHVTILIYYEDIHFEVSHYLLFPFSHFLFSTLSSNTLSLLFAQPFHCQALSYNYLLKIAKPLRSK
jgi:hypothetical protein